jgi:hypothetical protein
MRSSKQKKKVTITEHVIYDLFIAVKHQKLSICSEEMTKYLYESI